MSVSINDKRYTILSFSENVYSQPNNLLYSLYTFFCHVPQILCVCVWDLVDIDVEAHFKTKALEVFFTLLVVKHKLLKEEREKNKVREKERQRMHKSQEKKKTLWQENKIKYLYNKDLKIKLNALTKSLSLSTVQQQILSYAINTKIGNYPLKIFSGSIIKKPFKNYLWWLDI